MPQPVLPEVRLAEITQKLRADQQRLTERVERSEPRALAPAGQTPEAIENAAKAAVAAALAPMSVRNGEGDRRSGKSLVDSKP